jgi:hypothetical protein
MDMRRDPVRYNLVILGGGIYERIDKNNSRINMLFHDTKHGIYTTAIHS